MTYTDPRIQLVRGLRSAFIRRISRHGKSHESLFRLICTEKIYCFFLE